MTHQAHHIPWSNVSEAFEKLKPREIARNNGERLYKLKKPSDPPGTRRLAHFANRFKSTLEDFVRTYKPQEGSGTMSIFNDRYPTISSWNENPGYADPRAEIIMDFLNTRSTGLLTEIANSVDKEVVRGLYTMPGCNPGWSQVYYSALSSYIFLNVSMTLYDVDRGRLSIPMDMIYTRAKERSTSWQDGDTFAIPHRKFYLIESEDGGVNKGLVLTGHRLEEVRVYLRECWESLVISAWFIGKVGIEIDWAREVEDLIWHLWH